VIWVVAREVHRLFNGVVHGVLLIVGMDRIRFAWVSDRLWAIRLIR
jgi:hypothetical protein